MSATLWGWGYVVSGTLMIGLGGLLTTLGWNKLAARDQQLNTLRSLGREIELNGALVAVSVDLARRWPTRRPDENFPYEEYQATQATAVVTAGTLDSRDANDRELLEALQVYRRQVAEFNAALQRVGRQNPGLFIKVDLIPATDAKQWPKNVVEALSDRFRELRCAHEAVVKAMRARSPSLVMSGSTQHEGDGRASAA